MIFRPAHDAGQLLPAAYTMADSVIVGRFVGEEALAAVGASYSLTNVFISIAIGGGVGASVITGQTFGRRDFSRMKRSVSTALRRFSAISAGSGRGGPGFQPADYGAAPHPGEYLPGCHHLLEHLLFGSALFVHVQCSVLHVQRPGALPHSPVFADFFLGAQRGPGHLYGAAPWIWGWPGWPGPRCSPRVSRRCCPLHFPPGA